METRDVTLLVGEHPTLCQGDYVALIVSDDGTGIPQRVQKRIFERFFTADSAGGSGLGLAIARELAQRMDGRISISSSRRYTAFTLDLPPAREELAGRWGAPAGATRAAS
jgi:signal transduction histidine kinase